MIAAAGTHFGPHLHLENPIVWGASIPLALLLKAAKRGKPALRRLAHTLSRSAVLERCH